MGISEPGVFQAYVEVVSWLENSDGVNVLVDICVDKLVCVGDSEGRIAGVVVGEIRNPPHELRRNAAIKTR